MLDSINEDIKDQTDRIIFFVEISQLALKVDEDPSALGWNNLYYLKWCPVKLRETDLSAQNLHHWNNENFRNEKSDILDMMTNMKFNTKLWSYWNFTPFF